MTGEEKNIDVDIICMIRKPYLKRIKQLEKENAELKENHESDKQAIILIIDKGTNIEKENKELKEKVSLAGYRIAELKMQIEKMKCCGNCIWGLREGSCRYKDSCNADLDKWEWCV